MACEVANKTSTVQQRQLAQKTSVKEEKQMATLVAKETNAKNFRHNLMPRWWSNAGQTTPLSFLWSWTFEGYCSTIGG